MSRQLSRDLLREFACCNKSEWGTAPGLTCIASTRNGINDSPTPDLHSRMRVRRQIGQQRGLITQTSLASSPSSIAVRRRVNGPLVARSFDRDGGSAKWSPGTAKSRRPSVVSRYCLSKS